MSIQSMLSLPPDKIEENIAQALSLQQAGCDIIRVAVPNTESVRLLAALKEAVRMPVVADIHFDYKLALESAGAGADKIRINPGNIGADERVKAVANACRKKGIPIRIGVNSGSVEKHILAKHGSPTPQAMVESALYHASLLERYDFTDIAISIKSGYVPAMVAAYRLAGDACEYPLHLGVTHAGTLRMGTLKNAIGIGSLLLDGIGDTIRVSLADTPEQEIYAAQDILRAVEMSRGGVEVIACPTCGRTTTDVIALAQQVEQKLKGIDMPMTIAVMGCVVNGPGEAREADLGICGGKGTGLLFAKGEVIKRLPQEDLLEALLEQAELLQKERENA